MSNTIDFFLVLWYIMKFTKITVQETASLVDTRKHKKTKKQTKRKKKMDAITVLYAAVVVVGFVIFIRAEAERLQVSRMGSAGTIKRSNPQPTAIAEDEELFWCVPEVGEVSVAQGLANETQKSQVS